MHFLLKLLGTERGGCWQRWRWLQVYRIPAVFRLVVFWERPGADPQHGL